MASTLDGSSGSRGMVVWAANPLPHVGRRSASSGRARANRTSGTSRTWVARYSSRSSCEAAAQWMSSNMSTVGCSPASASASRRTA